MSDIKEVKVAMSEADIKAFSRGTTRRRRVKRSNDESPVSTDPLVGGSSVAVEKGAAEIATLPAPVAPPAVIIPVSLPTSAVAPQPALSTTTAVGGAISSVKIQAKKSSLLPTSASVVPFVPVPGPRILSTKKRISAAPAAHTLKKPRLVITAGALPAPSGATQAPSTETETTKMGVVSGGFKKKRRFTERKISIEVKSAASTRKHRRTLKRKIESMPIASVKKFLLRKGVLKPKADGKLPPEDMMRSMLKDYLLLHTAE